MKSTVGIGVLILAAASRLIAQDAGAKSTAGVLHRGAAPSRVEQAAAGEIATQQARASAKGLSPVSLWWPTAVVLALIGAAAWFARRKMVGGHGAAGPQAIRILARQPLSSKQSLCLVRLGHGIVLLGVSPDRIQPLAHVSDPEEASSIIAALEGGRSDSFTHAFTRMFNRESEREQVVAETTVNVPGSRMARVGADMSGLLHRIRAMSV